MGDLTGQKVLVTGGDGFIGSHLVERLLDEGAHVRALCLYTSEGSLGWLDGLPAERLDAIELRLGDIRDPGFVRSLVEGQDLVLHLAALIAIPYSYLAPRSFVDTNIGGTLNVLEAVRSEGCRMINTSTSEVYGTPDEVPIRESHPLKGQSPYSASKIGADKLCEAYALSFDTQVMTLRPFNTYGPRQSLRAVIPTVLAQLLAGAETIKLGSLTPRRDFTFVDDTVDGFIKAAEAEPDPGEVVQLGTGDAVSIGELVELCKEVVGSEAEVVTEDERVRPAGSEVQVLVSDPRRALDRLAWRPAVSLGSGLKATVDWLAQRSIDIRAVSSYQR